jgi:hypothetical protein
MLTKQQKVTLAVIGGCCAFCFLICAGSVGVFAWTRFSPRPVGQQAKAVPKKALAETKVTRANYGLLREGMRLPAVEAILGDGKEVSTRPGYSVPTARQGPIPAGVAIFSPVAVWNWSSPSGCSITIEFLVFESRDGGRDGWSLQTKSIVGD